jgi:hypothetical protein
MTSELHLNRVDVQACKYCSLRYTLISSRWPQCVGT